jgi:SAM-dependent methyltransferase
MNHSSKDEVRRIVRERYGEIATSKPCGCGSTPLSSCCGGVSGGIETLGRKIGYSKEQLESVVEGANMGLGCGNPLAIGSLKPGETVLDLGSGGGFDCFLAAKAVGAEGLVIGVDMTAEMVSKARANAERIGVENLEFRLGEIEHLPVADGSVDVILSNCVINLSPEKQKVFTDAFRVLKPGGRLAISDIVALADMPEHLQREAALLTGCVAGAERAERLAAMLADIGFGDVRVAVQPGSREAIRDWFPGSGAENYVASATIEAVKPLP